MKVLVNVRNMNPNIPGHQHPDYWCSAEAECSGGYYWIVSFKKEDLPVFAREWIRMYNSNIFCNLLFANDPQYIKYEDFPQYRTKLTLKIK